MRHSVAMCMCFQQGNKEIKTLQLFPHFRARASSDFGPSQQWLQRKQGGRGNGTAAGAGEELAFLRPERRDAWKAALTEDGQRQVKATSMICPLLPPSRLPLWAPGSSFGFLM